MDSDHIQSEDDEQNEALLGQHRKHKANIPSPWTGAVVASLMMLSLAAGISIAAAIFMFLPVAEAECVERLSIYSPANEAVEYYEYNFDNMFSHKTAYRGPPTIEREKLWQELWDCMGLTFNHGQTLNFADGEVSIPLDKLRHLVTGVKLEKNWKTVASDKGGGYAAAIGVFHQLHCLDYIRQYTWGDYYERHNLTNPQKSTAVGRRMHTDHCIEELRKTLMCYGDTAPMLVEIDPEAPIGERSDFDSRHKCRDYEKIRRWLIDHLAVKWPS